MIRLFACLLVILSYSVSSIAQDENLKYDNHVYLDNIRSVRFHVNGLLLTYPIIDLNSGSQLLLSFDDLDGDVKDYVYTFVHCDKDWNPSDLTEMDYLDGFSEERIENYRYSFKIISDYTHYQLLLPNRDIRWTKSGNYLLKVYEDEGDKRLAITRRFMVVEPIVEISPNMVRPAMVSKSRTHEEIDFVVDHQRLQIRSPQQEVSACILQNGRWDNAIMNITPLFARQNSMIFDYQNKVVFKAGREFRNLDLRSFDFRSESISELERYDDGFDVTLYRDQKRFDKVFTSLEDINGNYVIETKDQRDFNLSSEYANVFFALYSPQPYYDQSVYIVGAISDWKLLDRFKMIYNDAINSYVAKVELKQGFYNYAYAVVDEGDTNGSPNLSEVEGDYYEAQNEYTILIYYRPFGERYDRLIGGITFTSNF